MKKIFKVLFILLGIIIGYYLIIVAYNNFCILIPSDSKISEKLVLKVKENTLTNSSATIVLENNTDNLWSYSEHYELEKKINGIWYKVVQMNNPSYFLHMPHIYPGEIKEIECNFDENYHKLTKGNYRLVMNIMETIDLQKDITSDYQIATYFKIE